MGGFGSGNWYRHSTKDITSDYCNLDIHYLVKNGFVAEKVSKSGCSLTWSATRAGVKRLRSNISFGVNTLESSASHIRVMYSNTSSKEAFDYKISLTTTIPHYGGIRWWFMCPIAGCGKRVRKLYLGSKYFACRRCYNLAYESQNESTAFRFLTKAQNIHEMLGGSGCVDDWVPRPKGMHQRTYDRLIREMERYHHYSMLEMAKTFRLFDEGRRKSVW